ncbi:MAG: MBL fold metallo-hydrolase [Gaiellaceae bacterium]
MTLAVDRYELGPIGTNCYFVRREAGAEEAVVIDPGGSASEIRLELARRGARCVAVLVTHGHWDHLLGVAELAEGLAVPVHMPAGERERLADPDHHGAPVSVPAHEPEVLVQGGDLLTLAGMELEVVSVPGHTVDHVAYFGDGCLFSGDVLFRGSVGRTDLPGSDWDTLLASLRSLCERFPPETVVYPGHGPSTTLGEELAHNPFLRELRQ